jgi:hypothetical protein
MIRRAHTQDSTPRGEGATTLQLLADPAVRPGASDAHRPEPSLDLDPDLLEEMLAEVREFYARN